MRTNRRKNTVPIPETLENAKEEQNRIARTIDKNSIEDDVYKGEKVVINDPTDYYHGQKEFEVRYALRKLYHNKCAYCETIEYKPDVEHYRPKKRITGQQRNSHGYYWLCYHWSNLLPACSACNSGNGKWDKFPVLGTRVTTPPFIDANLDFNACEADSDYMLAEQPAVLHPEVDTPENFLKLEWNGRLSPLDGSNKKGYETIRVCDLNRGNLIYNRKQIIDSFINDINAVFQLYHRDAIDVSNIAAALNVSALDLIKERSNPLKPYSFIGFYITKHFNDFVNDNFSSLTDVERQLLIETF